MFLIVLYPGPRCSWLDVCVMQEVILTDDNVVYGEYLHVRYLSVNIYNKVAAI